MQKCSNCFKVYKFDDEVDSQVWGVDGIRWQCNNPNCRQWNWVTSNHPYDEHPVDGKEEVPGGSTPSQYALPENAKELQDLIEHREMNFAQGNMFKANYRLGNCDHSNRVRDLNKIIWFAKRELGRIVREGEDEK